MNNISKPAVYVCYGFCEGPHIGRHFAKTLESAGFQIVHSPQQADIFIGHSGGCLQIPAKSTVRLAVLIGIPYWPGRSLVGVLFEKNRREYIRSQKNGTSAQWWTKFWWNCFYFWNMYRNFRMQRAMSRGPQTPPAPHTLCIRNRDDACCTETIWQVPAFTDVAFLSLPGEHDHLWVHPEAYAAIIKTYYGANVLAQTKAK